MHDRPRGHEWPLSEKPARAKGAPKSAAKGATGGRAAGAVKKTAAASGKTAKTAGTGAAKPTGKTAAKAATGDRGDDGHEDCRREAGPEGTRPDGGRADRAPRDRGDHIRFGHGIGRRPRRDREERPRFGCRRVERDRSRPSLRRHARGDEGRSAVPAATGTRLRVTQVKSTISHIARNRGTISALGLSSDRGHRHRPRQSGDPGHGSCRSVPGRGRGAP